MYTISATELVVFGRLIVLVAKFRQVRIFLEKLAVLEKLDASSHELVDMAEVKDIFCEISVFVKLEVHAEVAIANPLWQRVKEQRLIVIKAKVVLVRGNGDQIGVVGITTLVFVSDEVHGSGARQVRAAGARGTGGHNAWLQLVSVGVRPVRKVGKAQRVVVV